MVEFYDKDGSLFSNPAQFQSVPPSGFQTFQAAAPPSGLDVNFLIVLVFFALLAFLAVLLILFHRDGKRDG